MRIKILRLIILSLFGFIVGGLGYLQILQGDYYFYLSRNNRIRVVPVPGLRGRIYDRNGIILADNRASFDVAIVPQEAKDLKRIFTFLGQILEITPDEIRAQYKKRKLTPFVPVVVASDIDMSKAIRIEEKRFLYPGVIVQLKAKRIYPLGEKAAHVLGYVRRINRSKQTKLKEYGYSIPDIVGYSGVEEYYDTYLRGKNGGVQIEVNNRGKQVQILGSKEPVRGEDITLTIDSRIQKMAADALGEKKGAIVIIDIDTGEVLALVSSPSYDPNALIKDEREKIYAYSTDPDAPFLNRAISGQYPPGSVFKIVMAIAGLESKKITPDTTFRCPGYYKLGKRKFKCTHVHGIQNLTEAIAHSCNVYFYNVGLRLGPELITHYAQLLGLGQKTNIDLPYEKKGRLPFPRKKGPKARRLWYDGDTLNYSIGQGAILTTPIQLASMMLKVARNGEGITPHVLRHIGDTSTVEFQPSQELRVSLATFEVVKAGMKAAVGDYAGTAHLISMKDLTVYGKTGTAQAGRRKLSHAWFAGFCPSPKRRISFCVFLEHGGSSYNAVRVTKILFTRLKNKGLL